MKTIVAPNGRQINIPEGRIMACGLTAEDIQLVECSIPSDEYEVYIPDIVTDIIAIDYDALIIKPSGISPEDREILIDYYTELGGSFDETIFWIGHLKPPSNLRPKFHYYENFGELSCVLPTKLKEAHHKVKNARAFSKKMADCLMILSLIRSHPGIKTKEMADKLELSIRTVQRYISTLQATGEWIEYDTAKRGWRLQDGISILFGDHLK